MSSVQSTPLADHIKILVSYEKEYHQSKGDGRQKIINAIIEDIASQGKGKSKQSDTKGLELVSQLFHQCYLQISPTWTQKIKNWYGNHKNVPLKDESTLVPVGTIWNYRLVIQHLFKDDISKHMEKTGLKSTDGSWLKKFHWAVNRVIESLGEEDSVMEKYGEIAKAWNEAASPDEIKRRLVVILRTLLLSNAYLYCRIAMKKSGPTINSFLKKMNEQMGVSIIGFAAYRDEEGKLCTFEYVTLLLRPTSLTKAGLCIASPLRMTRGAPSMRHTLGMSISSLENGGNGSHRRVR